MSGGGIESTNRFYSYTTKLSAPLFSVFFSLAHVLCTWMPLVRFGPKYRAISLYRTLLEYINSHAYKRLNSVYIYCTKLTPMKLQGLKALNTKRPTLVFYLSPTKPLQTYEHASPHWQCSGKDDRKIICWSRCSKVLKPGGEAGVCLC